MKKENSIENYAISNNSYQNIVILNNQITFGL